MRKLLLVGFGVSGLFLLAAILYGAKGFYDSYRDSDALVPRANALIAAGLSPQDLGERRSVWLLSVEDPGFLSHQGVDFTTPGAGLTTLTQSLAKRLAFDSFEPGLAKIRQTGYALGLEQKLTKNQIFALFLQTVEMGRGPEGWMTGFFSASEKVYGKPVKFLNDRDFLSLVAVMIAPGKYRLLETDPALDDRVRRIQRLVSKACVPDSYGDVWLNGCD